MKSATLFGLLAGLVALVEAQPFKKHHGHHLHGKRYELEPTTVIETITVYVDMAGNPLASATSVPKIRPATGNEASNNQDDKVPVKVNVVSTTKAIAEAPVRTSAPASPSSPAVQKEVKTTGTSGLDLDFPDGQIDCTHFPSEYGALATSWVTKDGWSGLQFMEKQANGEIRLANADAKGVCGDGMWCSYACPPGYSKTQWPEEAQPENGESIGGLSCNNGKLWLTRPKASRKLCVAGADNTKVVNQLDKSVAICRTDYPGTEKMSVPIFSTPGSTVAMTVPYQAQSYVWQNKPTSAQYYVNNAGVSLEEGCVWGIEHGGKGNWSPMVFGASVAANGETFVSLFQNPLNSDRLNFNVKIDVGNGKIGCKYENGEYYGPDGNAVGDTGCTASILSNGRFIFY